MGGVRDPRVSLPVPFGAAWGRGQFKTLHTSGVLNLPSSPGHRWASFGWWLYDPDAHRSGKGNALVGYLLRTAVTRGCTSVFALTTRTAHYFIERGFKESVPPRIKTHLTGRFTPLTRLCHESGGRLS